MSLLDVMGRHIDGTAATPVTWGELARYLRAEYWDNRANVERKAKAARRQNFYAGGGDAHMCEMIGQVFKDPDVITLRQEWVEHAKHNNVLRRAINELATVYSSPARRTVAGADNDLRYQRMQQRTRQHEVMQRVNRLGYLHRAVFVYPRTRVNAGAVEPVIEVVTPDRFDAICHPEDPTMLVAISIDLAMKSAAMLGRVPARLLITATEIVHVDAQGMITEDSIKPHTFGRIPGVLYCVDAPTNGLLDSRATDDLESAHRAVWFENVLLLKESKSATRTTVISGDTSRTAAGQADDTERALVMQEGTSATTLDRSMDLKVFRDTAAAIYETAAANHGIPPTLLSHAGTQSADARELIRAPLKELRGQQQVALRDVEHDLAEVQAAVYASIPEIAFTADGHTVDFADPQTPLGQKESIEVFEQERRLGLTSTIAEVMRRNPDLTREAAQELIAIFIEDELWRNVEMRPLQAISGSLGADAVGSVVQPPNAGKASENDPPDLSWVEEVVHAAA